MKPDEKMITMPLAQFEKLTQTMAAMKDEERLSTVEMTIKRKSLLKLEAQPANAKKARPPTNRKIVEVPPI